jgi:FkbM family methyltransferase
MATVDIKLPGLPDFKLALHRHPDRHISPQLWKYRIWDPSVTSCMLSMIRTGQNVVDVGAHIGYFTIIMSLLVGQGGRVFAFEPEPGNLRLLRKNLNLNAIDNVTVESKAVSDRAERAGLHMSGDNTGDHRLYASLPGRKVCVVETVALDDYFQSLGRPVHFVKIDAQGLEPKILAGMASLIARNRQRLIILMEFSPGLLKCAGHDVADFLHRLESLDTAVFWLNKSCAGAQMTRATTSDLRVIADIILRTKDEDYSADLVLRFNH